MKSNQLPGIPEKRKWKINATYVFYIPVNRIQAVFSTALAGNSQTIQLIAENSELNPKCPCLFAQENEIHRDMPIHIHTCLFIDL